MKLNVDAHLWCLGTYAERYVPREYYDGMDADRQLEIMSKIEGLNGLFTFYPTALLSLSALQFLYQPSCLLLRSYKEHKALPNLFHHY